MTSIDFADAEHRALQRACRYYLRLTGTVALPTPAMLEERAIAQRVVDGTP